MKDPVTVEVARRNTPAELVAQVQHPVASDRKRELLAHLVKTNDWRQVLVFTKTKHGANRLAQQLEKSGIEADAIHGNKSQNARVRALTRFKDNELRVLVATDIAARGLDIEALPHVVNYDMPHVAEDYVHRIGRTGRAGVEGEAVSLVSPEDRPLMAAIERLINRKVEQRVIEGFEPGTRGEARQEQPRREQRQPQRRPQQQQQRHSRGQQQPRRGDGQQQRHRGNGQQQPSRGNGQQQPQRGNGQQMRRGPQPQHRSGRRGGTQGYISPELQAQIEEGRKLARQDVREDPVETLEAAQAPAPRRAPTVTHRATRGIRRVLGSLLGGNKNENEPGT
jgi:ATP-dependent RNA helicase RhlE